MEYKFTTANFEEEVLKSDLPVLVDFYADWCGPCKMMAPIVERMAQDYDGKLKVGKCDTQVNMPLVQKYRVSNIPALIIFRDGKPIANLVGYKTADELYDEVDAVI